jgi:hypothetical protein
MAVPSIGQSSEALNVAAFQRLRLGCSFHLRRIAKSADFPALKALSILSAGNLWNKKTPGPLHMLGLSLTLSRQRPPFGGGVVN